MAQKVSTSEALAQSNFDNLPATSYVRLPVVRGIIRRCFSSDLLAYGESWHA